MDDILLFSLFKQEPDFMLTQRLQAKENIERLHFPDSQDLQIDGTAFMDASLLTYVERDESGYGVLTNIEENNPLIIQYGSETVFEQLPTHLIEQGVILTDLFTAMQDYPALVEKYLQTVVAYDRHKLTAFHYAYMNGGLFVYIPENVCVTESMESILIQDSHQKELFAKHILLIAEKNSAVSFVETLQTFGDVANSASVIVEVVAKEGAKVQYTVDNKLSKQTAVYLNRQSISSEGAHVFWNVQTVKSHHSDTTIEESIV